MKKLLIGTIVLLFPLNFSSIAQAQTIDSSFPEAAPQLLAGFGVSFPGGRVQVGDDDDQDQNQNTEDSSESNESTANDSTNLSGEAQPYLDDYNGFKLDVPKAFKLHDKGQTTDWTGPILDGGATTIYVNAAPLPGVDPYMLQQTYKQQYEQNRDYTDVVATTVRYGNSTVPALRVKEANNRSGTRDEKAPDDIHRWHLFVFGNDRVYTWGFTGMYKTFKEERVQDLYEEVIGSIELVTIAP
jgi:hypothetical protein